MKTLIVTSILLFGLQNACGQTGKVSITDLGILVGEWKSELDEKYKDHPMIKRLNPQLNPNWSVFKWGVDEKIIHLSIYKLDLARQDTTLFIEGLILPDPASGSIKMIEYNAESDIYFGGDYYLDQKGNIIRYYEVGFANGTRSKFRERWIWTDENKKSFEWHTDSFINGQYREGEIVVRLYREGQ